MVYLHFPSKLTDEETMLQNKYAKLRKKKKALQDFQSPKPEPEKVNPLKRQLEPKDAKEYAKKLVLSGKISVPVKAPAHKTLFKRPLGLERKLSEARSPAPGGGLSGTPGDPNYSPSGGMTPLPGSSTPFNYEPFTPSTPSPSSSSTSPGSSSGGSRNSGSFGGGSSGGGGNARFGGSIPRTKKFTTTAVIPPYNVKEPGTAGSGLKEFPRAIKQEFPGGDGGGPGGPRQGHTVHVRGKGPGKLTESVCREVFGKVGVIVNVTVEAERSCAFVTFSKVEMADKAIQEVNGTTECNVLLEVSFARRQPAVTELINDASASAIWMGLANSKSQKGTHQDKRVVMAYDDAI
jgi:negative elongation factor E